MPQAVQSHSGPPQPEAPHGSLVDLLEDVDVHKSSLIRVTGPSGLSALLWLCRHGYEQVGYQRPGFGPSEQPDVLMVAHTCDVAALERLLDGGPHVHEGGLLVFQCGLPLSAGLVDRLLSDHGYAVERRVHGVRRDLYLARRQRSPRLLQAA